MERQEEAYSFLFKKFVCVVALADRETGRALSDALRQIPLLEVLTCGASGQAESTILSQNRVHCCICGAGLNDRQGDELYLLKRFGDHVPFIMYFSGESAELSAECMRFDASGVLVHDPHDPGYGKFLVSVCTQIVKGVLFPLRSLRICGPLRRSLTSLFRHEPENVTQWADRCDMSRRNLCELWSNHCGTAAHAALVCFSLLCAAFTWYLNEALDRERLNAASSCLHKQRSLTRKYYYQMGTLQKIMFGKRNYQLLPVRHYEHIGFYNILMTPGNTPSPWRAGATTRRQA